MASFLFSFFSVSLSGVLLDSDRFGAANAKDRILDTALHSGSSHGFTEVCKTLLLHPRFTRVTSKNRNGWTALHSAASNGHGDACQAILSHQRFSTSAAAAQNMFGGTSLHCAARNGHAHACKILLDHRKFAGAICLKDCVQRTPLHWGEFCCRVVVSFIMRHLPYRN